MEQYQPKLKDCKQMLTLRHIGGLNFLGSMQAQISEGCESFELSNKHALIYLGKYISVKEMDKKTNS